jgi:hypothetical protein
MHNYFDVTEAFLPVKACKNFASFLPEQLTKNLSALQGQTPDYEII